MMHFLGNEPFHASPSLQAAATALEHARSHVQIFTRIVGIRAAKPLVPFVSKGRGLGFDDGCLFVGYAEKGLFHGVKNILRPWFVVDR